MEPTELSEQRQSKSMAKPIAIFVLFLAILGLLFYFKALFIAATVNGTPISRFEVIKRAETKSGAEALNSLIDRQLIQSEANKQGIVVSEQEVAEEISNIEARIKEQGSTLSEALDAEGLSFEDLQSQVYIQKLVESILKPKIEVTDAEVENYMKENQTVIPEGEEGKFKGQLKEQLTNQKLSQEYTGWIENLRANAKIRKFIDYGTN